MSISKKGWQELNEMPARKMPRLGASSFIDDLTYYHKMFCGEYYDNNNLKGKKMSNVFETVVIQTDATGKVTILVPITSLVAKDPTDAKQITLIANATVLQAGDGGVKEGIDVLVRPFC